MNRTASTLPIFFVTAALAQVAPNPTSDMLEDRLQAVVTVEIKETSSLPRAIFGAAVDPRAAKPKVDPYRNSVYLANAVSVGSGFVIQQGSEYFVVTNCHVIEDAAEGDETITAVSTSGDRYKMQLAGADTIRDLAVLRFRTKPGRELKPLVFRATPLRVGERVFALGNPSGRYPSSVSDGIVSGLNRMFTASAGYIQSTAMLTGGNSGGPLIDSRGTVVGVNTWGALEVVSEEIRVSNKQLNYALNAPLVQDSVNQIIAHGRVRRGSLGIQVSAIEVGSERTFIVNWAHPSIPPTSREKLMNNSLTHLNGVAIRSAQELFGLLDQVKPGQNTTLRLLDSKEQTVEVSLVAAELTDQRLAEVVAPFLSDFLGVTLSEGSGGVSVRLSKTKFCEPEAQRIVTSRAGRKVEDLSSFPDTMQPVAAGVVGEGSSLIYPVPNLRSLLFIARRAALEGRLSLLASAPNDAVDLINLVPRLGLYPIATVLH